MQEFKNACREYLYGLGLDSLRAYGRWLQMKAPTKLKKGELIEEILRLLCGEITSQRNLRGAPIKSRDVDQNTVEEIEKLKFAYGMYSSSASADIEKSKNANEQISSPIMIRFTVCPSLLNERQRRLLNELLSSL